MTGICGDLGERGRDQISRLSLSLTVDITIIAKGQARRRER
jgi:hypothetical protein